MTPPILTTERMILTPVALSDFEDMKTLWADNDFTQAIGGRGPLSQEEVWFRLLRDLGHWSALGRGNWSMRMKDTGAYPDIAPGAYVGSVGVLHYLRGCVPPMDAPELGWGIGTAFHGQGLAREGLDAALIWADADLTAPRTVCMITPTNAPSLKLAERTGYRPYADGVYNDHPVILLERPNPALLPLRKKVAAGG